MPANLTPAYFEAEKRYRAADTVEEKIEALNEMLRVMPKHKGTDGLRAELRTKIAKFQKEASAWIKASSSLSSDGYIVKFRIPLLLFGFDGPPIEEKKLTRFGCTVVVHDIDNRYRPEEETRIATSNFNPSESNTYGALFLVPQDMWYGEMLNIYRDEILKYLTELGY